MMLFENSQFYFFLSDADDFIFHALLQQPKLQVQCWIEVIHGHPGFVSECIILNIDFVYMLFVRLRRFLSIPNFSEFWTRMGVDFSKYFSCICWNDHFSPLFILKIHYSDWIGFFDCIPQHKGSLFPHQRWNPCPLKWKRQVLTTKQPRKSHSDWVLNIKPSLPS